MAIREFCLLGKTAQWRELPVFGCSAYSLSWGSFWLGAWMLFTTLAIETIRPISAPSLSSSSSCASGFGWLPQADQGAISSNSLTATQLLLGPITYDKADIRDLSVQAPNGVVVTGRNQFELQANSNLANLAAAQNYSVVFNYGLKRVLVARFLTEPQAYAVAREIASWLAIAK